MGRTLYLGGGGVCAHLVGPLFPHQFICSHHQLLTCSFILWVTSWSPLPFLIFSFFCGHPCFLSVSSHVPDLGTQSQT